ncbi:MAG: FadR/GntR family transcriptional regulator [Bryobacteraceae bacterium]
MLLDGISHLELFEARMIVEPELAARAAERATAEDVTNLRRIIAEMKENVSDRERLIELDIAFHDTIFQAAGNRVCRQMFRVIHRLILASITRLSLRADLDAVMEAHKSIYSAIASRDPAGARANMANHLNAARGLFLRDGEEAAPQAKKAQSSRKKG